MAMIRVRPTLRQWLDTKIMHEDSGPRKWSYDDLAKAINVSESLLRKVMSGHANVTTNLVMKICAYTNYDLGELFFFDRVAEPGENGKDTDGE